MSFLARVFPVILLASVPSAFAENRAVVFSTTCPEYETTQDDIEAFVVPAIGELDPLRAAGWNVVPLLGGHSVWCQEGTPGCKRTKAGSLDHLLQKSSFKAFQVRPASKTNLLSTLNAALDGPSALHAGDKLLVSVITHGNRDIFCSADGYVAYETIMPIFKKLKDKGVQMGFDANHCFSGGGVQKLSPYACVVSIASSTTTGLEGNPTLENLLANHPNPSLEDLYLSRSVSYNALTHLREPEISGFTGGATINDIVSDKFYPGDKNDLQNDTLTARCAKEKGYYGPSCDELAKALKNFQALLEPWENSSLLQDHSNEFLALMDRYPDTHFLDVRNMAPLSTVTDSRFYANLSNDFMHFRDEESQYHAMMLAEERGISLVRQAIYPHYFFPTENLAQPGTDEILRKIVLDTLKYYHLPSTDASGHVTDARSLVSFLSQGNIREIARVIGNEYYTALVNLRNKVLNEANSDEDSANDTNGPQYTFPDQAVKVETWQNLIYERLNASITPYFTQVKTDSRDELLAFLIGHNEGYAKQAKLYADLNKDYDAFSYQVSARLSYSLTSAFYDYKAKLSSANHLSPREVADKTMLDACSAFKLR